MVRGRDASSNVGGRVQLVIQSYYVMLYQGGMDLKCPNVNISWWIVDFLIGTNLFHFEVYDIISKMLQVMAFRQYNAGATMNAKAIIAEYDISRDAYVARFHEQPDEWAWAAVRRKRTEIPQVSEFRNQAPERVFERFDETVGKYPQHEEQNHHEFSMNRKR
ncbi:unnamed protein product [Prunus armeniaca]